jgi:ornithine cyclodeaminase
MSLLLLNEDELRQIISLPEATAAIEAAFVANREGRITIPGSFSLALPDVNGEVDVKGAYLQDAPYYVIKIDNNFLGNPSINLSAHGGLITVFDAATGFPAAVLLDNGYLTHVRCGIVGALATRRLANRPINTVAIIGVGRMAFSQLKALLTTEPVELVTVWGAPPIEADNFARRVVEDHNVNITLAPSVEAAVTQADVIITATTSQQPLIRAEWLKPGVHITAAGKNSPQRQELHADVLQRADAIFVDSLAQCSHFGEIRHGLNSGIITPAHIRGDLGSLISGHIPGRQGPAEITLADLTGLEWQDATIATLALENALFLGIGQRLEPGLEQSRVGQRVDNLL